MGGDRAGAGVPVHALRKARRTAGTDRGAAFRGAGRVGRHRPGPGGAGRGLHPVRGPGGWTPADVPLLDEAAELLGVVDRAERARERRERAARIAYAQGVLDIAAGSAPAEYGDALSAGDVMDAERLAERHTEGVRGTVAERAAADRTWSSGHVIVDEAQELSRMAWRVLMRRCPSRSMTLVGDVAQTGAAEGTTSWGEVLAPYVGERWRLARLSVNYRTPAEIMAVAAGLADGDEAEAPRAVRETGEPPWRRRVAGSDLAAAVADAVAEEDAALGEGRIAVIAPGPRVAELGAAVAARLGEAAVAYGPEPDLTTRVVVLDVPRAKGLEFDAVLVAEPEVILAASPRGRGDLYVALTRATRRLGILHSGEAAPEIAAAVPVG
ncbi:MAG: hypothetical protein GEV11_07420 [Streptosporangiales bacterium]|nr:hypothetical protein [Streptosporangiales bacterium]